MVLSALKNVFHLNNIHHCLCVFQLFSMKNINLFAIWLKWDFYTRTIYTWVFFNFFYWRLPLCELTIMVFPTLKHFFNPKNIHLSKMMFSTLRFPPAPQRRYSSVLVFNWRIFTSVRVGVFYTWKQIFTQRIYTSVQVDKNGIFYTKIFFLPEQYTPLCKCFSIFSRKKIYICVSWLKWCFLCLKSYLRVFFNFFKMKNIFPCAIWLRWCFLHLKMLFTKRIYTSVWLFFQFF